MSSAPRRNLTIFDSHPRRRAVPKNSAKRRRGGGRGSARIRLAAIGSRGAPRGVLRGRCRARPHQGRCVRGMCAARAFSTHTPDWAERPICDIYDLEATAPLCGLCISPDALPGRGPPYVGATGGLADAHQGRLQIGRVEVYGRGLQGQHGSPSMG